MLKIILIVLMVLLSIATALCLVATQAGDNSDARATAGIFYIPAIVFGVLDAIVFLIWWFGTK